ncbi:MAG: hypothetical protein QXM65_07455 [Candidatus Bathyarchaeia archaeon]
MQYCKLDGENCNMRIGIFEGKKADYNRKILKLLVEKEPLKAWDIAKQITKGSMDKTQDVYSTLIRKNGRLDELIQKEYLTMLPNKRYSPTFKGIIAYLHMEQHPKISESYNNILSLTSQIPDNFTMPFLGFNVDTRFIKKQLEKLSLKREALQAIKNTLYEENLQWIDLDSIHEKELAIIILLRLAFKDAQLTDELKMLFQQLE